MMRNSDGLSRNDRVRRITSPVPFAVIDNSMESLLRQAEEIAAFIRYHDSSGQPNGYFKELLPQLEEIRRQYDADKPDGNREPSQALLFTFLQQLHQVTQRFNQRWEGYADWFLSTLLDVEPLPPSADSVWLSFKKNSAGKVTIEKDLGFTAGTSKDNKSVYRVTADLEVQDIEVINAYSLYFERQKNIFPASILKFVTSLKIKDLLNDPSKRELMFGKDKGLRYSKTLGFQITSPSLLLREGKRSVSISFLAETESWNTFLAEIQRRGTSFLNSQEEKAIVQLLNNVFYLSVSTASGWENIKHYTLKMESGRLVLKFVLAEDFPATAGCNPTIHHFESRHPALKIRLNLDAWLYPYSWIKQFLLKSVHISTHVEGISNVLFYNELGRIDNSKPFHPFGTNTERGAWFAIGNYEMALKNTQFVDVHLQWEQLPLDEQGLYGYYAAYKKNIDNTSFKVRTRYLSDYKWKDTPNPDPLYLFSSTPSHNNSAPEPCRPLAKESRLTQVSVEKMPEIILDEEKYDYSIQSKSGFVSFVLEEPEIGFGEKYYRQLFTDLMIRNRLRKKDQSVLNTPITPLIGRITLDYCAEDCIDLRTQARSDDTAIFHLYPFGCEQVYPNKENKAVPLVFSLESDANLLLALKNVKGDELFTLYFEFLPVNQEIPLEKIPLVKWYWGDGYQWKEVDDGTILDDTTRNLLTSGCMKIYIPVNIDKNLLDKKGVLWLRAGIESNEEYIPELAAIHVNVVRLELDQRSIKEENADGVKEPKGTLSPEKMLEGIEGWTQITSFHGESEKENPINRMVRVSEYATHRGKAVTARDFERMALQAFPEIEKVKCLANVDVKSNKRGVVTLVVVPKEAAGTTVNWRPKASSQVILRIENYFVNRTSAYVTLVDVINPVYEELTLRCKAVFKAGYSYGTCRTNLVHLFNDLVAPWQKNQEPPKFGYHISLKDIYNQIVREDFVDRIEQFSVIQLTVAGEEKYFVHEYDKGNDLAQPSQAYTVFVPAREHIITAEITGAFGINDMIIDETFVI